MRKPFTPTPYLREIEGLVRSEDLAMDSMMELMKKTAAKQDVDIRPGDLGVPLTEFIDADWRAVHEYLAAPESLEEWTYSVRNMRSVGGDLFVGDEMIQPDTKIYIKADSSISDYYGTVVYPCAWDQGVDLWMRYYMTVVDAQYALGRAGTVVHWVNFHHKFYDPKGEWVPNYISEGMSRDDRVWVGGIWPLFYAGHGIEMTNLKKIVEARHVRGL